MFGVDGFYAIMVRSKERGFSSIVTSHYVGGWGVKMVIFPLRSF